MNVVLKLEGFLSWEQVWLKKCVQFFMAYPVCENRNLKTIQKKRNPIQLSHGFLLICKLSNIETLKYGVNWHSSSYWSKFLNVWHKRCIHLELNKLLNSTKLNKLPFSNGSYWNVSFPDEAIRGIDLFSAQVNSFPYIMSGRRPRVIRKWINESIASFGKDIFSCGP